MKAFLLILGILLTLSGGLMSLGVVIEIIEETSEYSLGTDIIGLLLLGIAPIVGGLFLCRQALSQRSDKRLTASNIANDQ